MSASTPVYSKLPEEAVPADGVIDTALYDQTLFAEDVLFTGLASRDSSEVSHSQSGKKLLLLGVLGCFALAILAGSLYLQMRRNQVVPGLIIEETGEQQQSQGIPALERQLSLLQNDIETADPLESPLAFPPLDFRLNLQDATSIIIDQQTR